MKIESCLILAAGFGTRMGAIGKKIPKVMWPVYEKHLIDLQIEYAKRAGCKKIFINTHCLHDILEKHLKENYPDIEILHEQQILDVGGAVHNLIRVCKNKDLGPTLLLNGDVLYFMDEESFARGLEYLKEDPIVIFGVEIGPGYSEIILEEERLVRIDRKSEQLDSMTYSGVALLDLSKLTYVPGVSKFFESVADYKSKKVRAIIPKNGEYHDFGTAKRYFSKMFEILEDIKPENLEITKFCKNIGAIKGNRCDQGYNSKSPCVINLSEKECHSDHNVIILKDWEGGNCLKEGIYTNQIFQAQDD